MVDKSNRILFIGQWDFSTKSPKSLVFYGAYLFSDRTKNKKRKVKKTFTKFGNSEATKLCNAHNDAIFSIFEIQGQYFEL